MERDNHNRLTIANGIPPAAIAANTSSAVIDTLGYDSLEWVLHVGAAFVGGGFTTAFFESDVVTFGGEETAVPTENVLGTPPVVDIGDTNKVYRVGVVGKKRFQQIRIVETGTITAGVIGVTANLSHARSEPTAAQFT